MPSPTLSCAQQRSPAPPSSDSSSPGLPSPSRGTRATRSHATIGTTLPEGPQQPRPPGGSSPLHCGPPSPGSAVRLHCRFAHARPLAASCAQHRKSCSISAAARHSAAAGVTPLRRYKPAHAAAAVSGPVPPSAASVTPTDCCKPAPCGSWHVLCPSSPESLSPTTANCRPSQQLHLCTHPRAFPA